MRKINFILFGLLIGFLSFSQIAAQNNLDTPANQKKFIKDYADKLAKRLQGKSVGYAFVVRYRTGDSEERAGGSSRRAPDANLRSMSVNDKFNIASVSKTITAAAVLKLMANAKPEKIDVDTPVYPYFGVMQQWSGTNIKTITFRELLTHHSGIRCDIPVDYFSLAGCIKSGIGLNDKKAKVYRNANFALLRYVIAEIFTKGVVIPSGQNATNYYPTIYNSYVQRHIFLPVGLKDIATKPTDAIPALAYQYPSPLIAGTDFGDSTTINASSGWNMSAKQLSIFVSNLMFTERIVPASVREQMKKDALGLYPVTHSPNLSEWGHSGHLPGKDGDGKVFNQGEINTMIVTYSNGISLSLIINSQFGPNQGAWENAKDAMLEMINNK